jgi:soluble lytic murein transglycosylase-like protein
MQVMSKIHHEKFKNLGGVQAALNPVANVRVGSRILKEYIARTGSVEGGLKMYVGAADMRSDGGYGAKVLNEYTNLKNVSAGKRVSIYTTTAAKKPAPAVTPAVATINDKPQQLTANEHQDNQF